MVKADSENNIFFFFNNNPQLYSITNNESQTILFFNNNLHLYFLILILNHRLYFAQSAGAVEYTDCTSAEE